MLRTLRPGLWVIMLGLSVARCDTQHPTRPMPLVAAVAEGAATVHARSTNGATRRDTHTPVQQGTKAAFVP